MWNYFLLAPLHCIHFIGVMPLPERHHLSPPIGGVGDCRKAAFMSDEREEGRIKISDSSG
jgi:hypothetical protein